MVSVPQGDSMQSQIDISKYSWILHGQDQTDRCWLLYKKQPYYEKGSLPPSAEESTEP